MAVKGPVTLSTLMPCAPSSTFRAGTASRTLTTTSSTAAALGRPTTS
eukprot:CAMPEP_0202905214 /NCGR_PEP_ID=MMETSP1392-20130828/33106_1 /ASSEMBLY_ACC=CAM_ASM_000868 /TAXON_ID=225041 /ORGANISM="Chlamydomonas chlamydogama, Strain SAG 11-48b" /LENGTH=46 /DNA_ID= /DNA_START= /DNA_END= /DNA_ORIENTATION=